MLPVSHAAAEQAWAALSGELLAFFERRVDPATAQDLRQETFVRLLTGLERLRDDERVAAYAHRVARNLVVDHYRGRRPTVEWTAEQHAPAPPPTPTDETVAAEVARWLPFFVEGLDEPTRAALALAELEGLTQREVAERLGLSLSGAKSRVQRGRRKLREALTQCCAVELDARNQVIGYTRRQCDC